MATNQNGSATEYSYDYKGGINLKPSEMRKQSNRHSELRSGSTHTSISNRIFKNNGMAHKFGTATGLTAAAEMVLQAGGHTSDSRNIDRRALYKVRQRQFRKIFHIHPKIRQVLPWGSLSVVFYTLLFAYEAVVIEMSTSYWWSFIVPVTIALTFSFVHGNFTATFWDAIGLKPNTVRK